MKPTVEQLATLAAALKRTGKETPAALTAEAVKLWEAAAQAAATAERQAAPPAPPPVKVPWKQPKSYPVTLDEFLALCLPTLTGRTAERMALFRAYVGAPPVVSRTTGKPLVPPKPKEEVDAAIAQWRASPLENAGEFNAWAAGFTKWAQEHKAATTSEARRKAAKKPRGARPPRQKLRAAIEGDLT